MDHVRGLASVLLGKTSAAGGLVALACLVLLLPSGCARLPQPHTLSVTVYPPGSGSVHASGGQGGAGQQVSMNLAAIPTPGYRFDHWTGGASGTAPQLTIAIDSDKSVTAHFAAIMVTLETNAYPSGSGNVTPSGGEYLLGTTVTLEATPSEGYRFDSWTNDVDGSASTITLTMDSDKLVGAIFLKSPAAPAVLYSDDFSSDTGAWETFSEDYGAAYYQDGRLYVRDNLEHVGSTASMLLGQTFTNFAVEMEVSLVEGSERHTHGISYIIQDEDTYYFFVVSADGFYGILKSIGGQLTMLAGPSPTDYVRKGTNVANVLRVQCVGASMSLSVNGQLLKTVTDMDRVPWRSGEIGLYVDAETGFSSTSAFDNFVVTDLSPRG